MSDILRMCDHCAPVGQGGGEIVADPLIFWDLRKDFRGILGANYTETFSFEGHWYNTIGDAVMSQKYFQAAITCVRLRLPEKRCLDVIRSAFSFTANPPVGCMGIPLIKLEPAELWSSDVRVEVTNAAYEAAFKQSKCHLRTQTLLATQDTVLLGKVGNVTTRLVSLEALRSSMRA